MNQPQRNRNNQRRRPQAKRPGAADIWRSPGELPEIEPIALAHSPAVLLQSLGDPPLHDGKEASVVLATIIDRAAGLAAALALSAELLRQDADD
ncbi:unannotated protein [freshwater metagenome]|uniref:Unannotated protein n=1 Tax=freshwater metagenome TaxID=449393 RepID=A0A6J7CWL9_9ZZZZ|nr:hypothetical protein [Actinomycetota bacterium]